MKNLGIKKILNKRYKTIQNHKYTLVQKLNILRNNKLLFYNIIFE